MRYKRVKKIDHDFSVLGFGCWGASGKGSWTDHGDKEQIKAIRAAIDAGVNFFDVAPVYGLGHAEEVLGKAIKGHRNDIFIASKVGLPWNERQEVRNDVSRANIMMEIEESLKRLNVEYVDLYQVHWPSTEGVPLEETIEAMRDIKASGKARYIGLSNFSVESYKKANEIVDIVSMQGLFNMLEHNPKSYHDIPLEYQTAKEVLPLCEEEGLAFLPYSPLFQGLLTGKITADTIFGKDDVRNANPKLRGNERIRHLSVLDEIKNIESLQNKKLAEIALNYLVAQKNVTSVIATQANIEEVMANIKALEWEMDQTTVGAIDELVKTKLL